MAPTLKIEFIPTNERVMVSWPVLADDWRLEITNTLGGAIAPVPPPYPTNAGTISATFTNAPAVGNQFFRLHKL